MNNAEDLLKILSNDAKESGYNLSNDTEFVEGLIDGLLKNESRYGYMSCPCRLAEGSLKKDVDMVCPCDYRDKDLDEYGCCYCGLYVSDEILEGRKALTSIPDRRLQEKSEKQNKIDMDKTGPIDLPYPIWRCSVCGYICARENPPEKCPICKVGKERFQRFL